MMAESKQSNDNHFSMACHYVLARVAVEQGLKALRVSDAVCSQLEHHEPCSHLAKIIFMCCFGFFHL